MADIFSEQIFKITFKDEFTHQAKKSLDTLKKDFSAMTEEFAKGFAKSLTPPTGSGVGLGGDKRRRSVGSFEGLGLGGKLLFAPFVLELKLLEATLKTSLAVLSKVPMVIGDITKALGPKLISGISFVYDKMGDVVKKIGAGLSPLFKKAMDSEFVTKVRTGFSMIFSDLASGFKKVMYSDFVQRTGEYFKGAWNFLKPTFAKPFIDVFGGIGKSVSDKFKGLKTWIFGAKEGDEDKKKGEESSKKGGVIGGVIGGIFSKFTAVLGVAALLTRALDPLIKMVQMSLQPLLNELSFVFTDIMDAVAPMIKELLPVFMDIFKELTPVLSEVVFAVLTPLIDVIKILLPVFGDLAKTILPLLVPPLQLAGKLLVWVAKSTEWFVKGFKAMIDWLKKSWIGKLLSKAFGLGGAESKGMGTVGEEEAKKYSGFDEMRRRGDIVAEIMSSPMMQRATATQRDEFIKHLFDIDFSKVLSLGAKGVKGELSFFRMLQGEGSFGGSPGAEASPVFREKVNEIHKTFKEEGFDKGMMALVGVMIDLKDATVANTAIMQEIKEKEGSAGFSVTAKPPDAEYERIKFQNSLMDRPITY